MLFDRAVPRALPRPVVQVHRPAPLNIARTRLQPDDPGRSGRWSGPAGLALPTGRAIGFSPARTLPTSMPSRQSGLIRRN